MAALPPDKNFLLREQDGGPRHTYVIDLPAKKSAVRPALLYQSDLGEDMTRAVKLTGWMEKKGRTPFELQKRVTHFDNMAQGHLDVPGIAALFDIDGDPPN